MVVGLVLIAGGIYSLLGAVFGWDFRNGTRVFFALLGTSIIVIGVLLLVRVLEIKE